MKLKYDDPLSNLAFKFKVRRYSVVRVSTFRLQKYDTEVVRCRLNR